MSGKDKKFFNITGIRDKVKSSRDDDIDVQKMFEKNVSWQAISHTVSAPDSLKGKGGANVTAFALSGNFNFSGKILSGGKYSGENLQNSNFSASDLKETDFSKALLQGADFSGADLSGADLSGANLDGAIFSGAKLRGTNFTGAKMNGVLLVDADIQDAILLDVEMDDIALEELQALVEYLAVNYPHKLNLARMNLTMLDFTKIDLSRVNLRGVDFTGVDFTGVNIFEMDLSECIISPEQIAQALGRMPTPLELKKILAPKNRKKSHLKGIDFSAFFDARGTAGVWDLSKHPGITVADLLKAGKQIYNAVITKPEPKDEEIMAKFQHTHEEKQEAVAKEHNAEMRRAIEEHKREVLGLNEKTGQMPRREIDVHDYEADERVRQQEREKKLHLAKEQYLKQKQQVNTRVQDAFIMQRSRGPRERS